MKSMDIDEIVPEKTALICKYCEEYSIEDVRNKMLRRSRRLCYLDSQHETLDIIILALKND